MSAYKIKMSVFISYLLDEVQRPTDWADLYSEYISLRENKSSSFILALMREITYLKTKKFIVDKICQSLIEVGKAPGCEAVDVSGLTQVLKEYGYRGAYDLRNKSTFSRDIRAALSGVKRLKTQWERKEEELKTYQEKHAGKEVQRKDFYVWAITLSKYYGFRVNLDEITVAEWCTMINEYERYCEVQNAEYNNTLKR